MILESDKFSLLKFDSILRKAYTVIVYDNNHI